MSYQRIHQRLRFPCSVSAVRRAAGFAVLGVALSSCSGDDTTAPASHSIEVALSPSAVTVVQGQTQGLEVTVTRGGGFAGAVDLSLEGVPAGVTGTFAPAPASVAGASKSTLTMSAGGSAVPGQTTVTVRARAAGVADRTGSFTLLVTAAATPDFSITLQPGALSVIQGREATHAITIERRDGFTEPVTLSVAGTPAGMNANFAGETQLRLMLGRNVHAGDHMLTVQGVAGERVRSANLRVRVFQSRPVSAGWTHSLAVREDGSLWAWGRNHAGQLGLGNTTQPNSPVRVGSDTDWVAVAAGSDHSIALKLDGSLWVAGSNQYGQLGISGAQHPTFQRVGSDNDWVGVGVGDYHSIAIKADRSLWLWGRNRYGQLGTGNTTQQNAPARVAGNDWVLVTAGSDHTVAIRTDGSLWAWGYNAYGQLGNGTATGHETEPRRVGMANDWLLASAGMAGGNTVAIKTNGTLWGWGRNISGELGLGSVTQVSAPQQLTQANDWIHAGTAGGRTMAVKADGSLWSTGSNASGALAIAGTGNRYEFVQAMGSGWQFMAPGESHTLGIGAGGALFTWGSNDFGKLGQGITANQGFGLVSGFTARWP